MKRLIAAAAGVVALAVAGSYAGASVSPGCNTRTCAKRVCTSRACKARTAPKATAASTSRGAWASWYGPGLYGNPLACGGTLSPGTLGVANKTLPCGTQVRICYNGCKTVSVVDRGPYVGGREFDLTAATAQAVGLSGVQFIHYVVVE